MAIAATDAFAQTQSIPELPEAAPTPPPDEATPATATALVAPEVSPWDYSLGLGVGWESNVGIETGEAPGDLTSRLRGSLGYLVTRPSGDITITADGTGYFYSEQVQFNRADGNLHVDVGRQLSKKTDGTLGLGVGYTHTDSTEVLIEQGLLLPITRTFSLTGGVGMRHRLGARTNLRASLRFYRIDFLENDDLQDSTSLRFTVGLDRRLGEANTFAVKTAVERANLFADAEPGAGSGYWTYFFVSEWTHAFSARTATLVDAGGSYTPASDEAGLASSGHFHGGVSLSRKVKRNQLSVFYRREVVPLFGLGRLAFTDRVGLSASIPWGNSWDAGLSGSYTREAASSTEGVRAGATDFSATVGVKISSRFRLSAEGRYLRRSYDGPDAGADALRAGIFITFSRPAGAQARGFEL